MTEIEIVRSFPHQVQVLEHVWIPLSDGTRLAARIWLPAGAEDGPVPGIVEYIPYRKRDLTRSRDAVNHPYLAGHGYACVRVDLRGSGDSEGVLRDQFLEQEQLDGVEVLRWVADQPWCDGKVGMFGISWGGFAALQVAARRPPELGAVVAVSATDDLYRDNMHYMGGCLLGDNLSEATTMFAFNSCPPDPALVGDRWRAMWKERLEDSGLWLETWLEHQHRDGYWKPGSVSEDYAAIACPVLAASGWADGYSNAVFRLLEHLEVPRRGLIGPWSHKYPHLGQPGPAIGFLQETVRWFDHWLKGIETGVMAEPMLRAWMQDSMPPQPRYSLRPGRWVAEDRWPSPHIEQRSLAFGRGTLELHGGGADLEVSIQSPLSVGMFAGKWCSYAATPDLPGDQRDEDGGALVFETERLEQAIEILGAPRVELEVSANRPVAMVAVRLSDVLPDGKATRVSYGLLNLTHRDGHETPQPLEPGRRYRVCVTLNACAQHFPAGNRLRLSLSSSYWPLAWPPPEPVDLTIHSGGSRLILPTRLPRAEDDNLRPFGPPQGAHPLRPSYIEPPYENWRVVRDLASREEALEVIRHDGHFRIEEIDLEVIEKTTERYSSVADDFHSVRGDTRTTRGFRRGDWEARAETRTILTCDATHFELHATLDAYEGDRRIHSRVWNRRIPRRLV